mmetsp:Transcript_17596/g.71160  ORF Transcript_17596/g.71160 Transcript_17596/m.71160 type:complete len:484 (+) Transcript_17596:798-2249(+)
MDPATKMDVGSGSESGEENGVVGENGQVESVFFDNAAEDARKEQEHRQGLLDKQREARALVLPTADADVRLELRNRGEPVCLFGEDAHDRRERLRALVLEEKESKPSDEQTEAKEEENKVEPAPEEFFTEGLEELKQARLKILKKSLHKSRDRLVESRKRIRSVEFREEGNEVYASMQNVALVSSQIGDSRPLAACAFSSGAQDPSTIATGSWSGLVKLWDANSGAPPLVLKGHTERISHLAFHPSKQGVIASCSADKTVHLWDTKREERDRVTAIYRDHADRVSGVAFHPDGELLGSSSFDTTWRLYDLETGTCLLLQEGHSKPIYRIAFHPDGSLAASCGLDRAARVWDNRSGRCIMTFTGHVDSVLGADFSPDGYQLATGSNDNSIKIWDLRKRRCFYTIAAHSSCVTSVKYQPGSGHVLLSTSFDKTAKVWSRRGYVLVGVLSNHEEKVTCGDIGGNAEHIVTTCYDKTWKYWSCKEQF